MYFLYRIIYRLPSLAMRSLIETYYDTYDLSVEFLTQTILLSPTYFSVMGTQQKEVNLILVSKERDRFFLIYLYEIYLFKFRRNLDEK